MYEMDADCELCLYADLRKTHNQGVFVFTRGYAAL